MTVDRRWEWKTGSAHLATVVIVENLTDRELKVSGVELPGGVTEVSVHGDLLRYDA